MSNSFETYGDQINSVTTGLFSKTVLPNLFIALFFPMYKVAFLLRNHSHPKNYDWCHLQSKETFVLADSALIIQAQLSLWAKLTNMLCFSPQMIFLPADFQLSNILLYQAPKTLSISGMEFIYPLIMYILL